jgi:hypothetical protein
VTEGCRVLNNDGVCNLYPSTNVNKTVKSKRLRCVGYVTKNYVKICVCQHHGN